MISSLDARAFFRFCKVKAVNRVVDIAKKFVKIELRPDRIYLFTGHSCGNKAKKDWHIRSKLSCRQTHCGGLTVSLTDCLRWIHPFIYRLCLL